MFRPMPIRLLSIIVTVEQDYKRRQISPLIRISIRTLVTFIMSRVRV